MKKIFLYITVLTFIMLTLSLSGCKKYFEVGENPDQIADPPLNTLLSTATSKTAFSCYNAGSFTSFFTQYLASPTVSGSSDTYQLTDYSGTWNSIYFAMADINEMKKKAVSTGATEHIGVADLLTAYHLDLVIDLWGNGPYAEAFNNTILTPKYDDPVALYNTAVSLIDEGLAELAKTNAPVHLGSAEDLIYNGNVAQWIQFGNLLKARMLNKLSKKTTYNPASVLAAVDLSFKSNADDAKMANFAGNNPWADVATDNANLLLGGWLSEQFMDALNGKTYGVVDPRISKITDPTVNNNFVGTPNGVGNVGPAANTVKDETYISINSPLTGKTSPLYIATFAELKFIEAEAAFRSGAIDRAFTAYIQGITANMNRLGVSEADRLAYLASPAVATSSAALTLDQIFKEKYIVTYLNPEAWVDARRYDYKYKDFTLPANAALNTFIRRVDYVDDEKSKNGSNVPQITSLAEPLWWDQP
jgi:hypothetical protein